MHFLKLHISRVHRRPTIAHESDCYFSPLPKGAVKGSPNCVTLWLDTALPFSHGVRRFLLFTSSPYYIPSTSCICFGEQYNCSLMILMPRKWILKVRSVFFCQVTSFGCSCLSHNSRRKYNCSQGRRRDITTESVFIIILTLQTVPWLWSFSIVIS